MSTAKPSVFSATQRPDEAWLAKALPEAPLEPRLPIVDAHMHLWHHKSGYHYFAEEYAHDAAACGHDVQATVFIECGSMYRARGPEHLRCIGETEFAVGQAAIAASGKYTGVQVAQGIVGFADLMHARAQETLEAHVEAANGRFCGVRQRAKWDPDPAVRGAVCADGPGLLLRPAFGRGLDLLTRMGLMFEASIFHPQLTDVAQLARAHPDAQITVIHCGSPVGHSSYAGREAQVHADFLAGLKALAACPNVSMKMGGLLMCLGSFDFTTAPRPPTSEELAQLWRPWIEPCIELLGADRCMVSSNFPVDKAGMTYGVLWNTFQRITAGCSASEKAAIYSGTARRVYRLPPAA